MQSYFEYGATSMCGIPYVKLEGTREDWLLMLEKVGELDRFGLEWWTPTLRQMLTQFAAAFVTEPDREFWPHLYKWGTASGGPFVNGWIVRLFPYLTGTSPTHRHAYGRNPLIGRPFEDPALQHGFGHGLTTDLFPNCASRVPFTWNYLGDELEYEFVGGVLACEPDLIPEAATYGIRPRAAWAVMAKQKRGNPLRLAMEREIAGRTARQGHGT